MSKLHSISTGSIEEPDISYSQRLPVVNEKLKVFAKVRGNIGIIPVKFIFTDSNDNEEVLNGRAETIAAESAYVDYVCEWLPRETGFYKLKIEIACPDEKQKFSAETTIPVVWTQMHILSWRNPKSCKWVGTGVYVPDNETDTFPYWRRRGSKVLGFLKIRNSELRKLPEEERIKIIVSRAELIANLGYDGIFVDELGLYADESSLKHLEVVSKAFETISERFPDLRVYNWTGGGMLREEAHMAKKNNHVLMSEIYAEHIYTYFGSHSFQKHMEHRFDVIRNTDALFNYTDKSCAIAALGIGDMCGNCLKPLVEKRVRMYKRIAPEAPGICYYPGGPLEEWWNDKNVNYQEFLDELTMEYFIKPVLMMRDSDIMQDNRNIKSKQSNEIIVQVRNCGGMKAENIKINLSARRLKDNTVQEIGKEIIPEISKGIYKEKDRSKFAEHEYFDTLNINGTTYPVSQLPHNYKEWGNIYMDRALVEFDWVPEKDGYWEIIAEIIPDKNYTVLDGVKTLTTYVN